MWITKKLAPIEKIIHVGRVGVARIEKTADGYALGAVVSLARAAPVLGSIDPDIAEVLRRFGSIQVRACGTVGGNIANGSPIGDLAPMLIALGATLELRQGDNIRQLPLENFFLDYGKQDRKGGEFVRRLLVPKLAPATHFRAFKITNASMKHFGGACGVPFHGERGPDQQRQSGVRRHGGNSETRRDAGKTTGWSFTH